MTRRTFLHWLFDVIGKSTEKPEPAPRTLCRPSHGFLAGYKEFCIVETCPNYGKETVIPTEAQREYDESPELQATLARAANSRGVRRTWRRRT